MCGIVGILGSSWDESSLIRATDAMRHRGPDDAGIEFISTKEGRLGFGHRRLAILDLSEAGHQPMLDPISKNLIVFNGEIYNHQALREQLPEEKYRSTCDTETLLAAYREWGDTVVDHLVGMYAFAIWNAQKQELFLVRDRVGIKPLYYIQKPGLFAFASELNALLAGNLVLKHLDPESVESYLAFGAVQAPRTILKNTMLLLPGHWMRVNASGDILEIRQYWSLSELFSDQRKIDMCHDTQEKISECVQTAVRDRLLSDVPLGAFLSGGVDSSVVVGMMASSSSNRPRTFCLDFEEGPYREGKYAAEVAYQFGCDHKTFLVRPSDLLDRLDKAFSHMDQPTSDGINSYFVSGIARQSGVTAALSGQGGDELFAGYPSFRHVPRVSKLSWIPMCLRGSIAWGLSPFVNYSPRWQCFWDYVASGDASTYNAYAHVRSIFWDKIRKDTLEIPTTVTGADFIRQAVSKDELAAHAVDQVSQMEISCYLMNTLLRDLDAFSMAHSLEVRVPLLDHRLLELMASIPGREKIDRRMNKHLLVKTMEGRLPHEVVHRPKGLFWFPWNQWLRRDLGSTVASFLKGANIVPERAGLRADTVRAIWNRFQNQDPYVHWLHVWTLYVLLRWCEEKGVSL